MFLFGKIWYRLLIAGIRFVSVLRLFSWRHYLWTKTLLWQAENNYFKLSCGFKQLMVKSKALNSWWSNLRLFDRLVSTYMYFRESWLYIQNLDYQDYFALSRACDHWPWSSVKNFEHFYIEKEKIIPANADFIRLCIVL